MTTAYMTDHLSRTDNAALMKIRRDKHRERRRRQMESFYRNMTAENADKIIFLFDTDLNIA